MPKSAQLRNLLKFCILKVIHVFHWFMHFIYHFSQYQRRYQGSREVGVISCSRPIWRDVKSRRTSCSFFLCLRVYKQN